ncbi:MAG: trehalose-phosphatase [Bacteroidetes bacterium]|nr:trehalose-phosphatase [Bacteroidota bacterium]
METPDKVEFKRITKFVLEELSENYPVGIISGRKLDELKKFVGVRGVFYSGNHGVEIKGPGLKFVEPNSAKSVGYITSLSRQIERVLRPYGALIESKKYSVSVHYRTVKPHLVQKLLFDLDALVRQPLKEGKVKLLRGKKVVEVKAPVDWNKGKALELILRKIGKRGKPIFFGDDLTDEFGFEKVNALGGISVFVGRLRRTTAAKYRIDSPAALVGELAKFLFLLS